MNNINKKLINLDLINFHSDQPLTLGKTWFNGKCIFIQAIGVRIKKQSMTPELFYDLDKNYIIGKDGRGNLINGKIINI